MVTAEAEAVGAVFAATQRDLAQRTSAVVVAYWLQQMAEEETSGLRRVAELWLDRSVPVIIRARRQSEQAARGYYLAQRRLELPDEPAMKLPPVPEVDRAAVRSSLWVTGPRAYVDAGKAVDDIFSEERVNAITGAVSRHTMNAGRTVIDEAYKADIRAVGYYRTEDSDPCYFCAALLSRGTVYKEDSFDDSDARFFGPGDAKVHDHCGGNLVPEYTGDPFPGNTAPYGELWKKFKYENQGPDDLEAWRSWFEAHQAATAA